MKAEIRAATSDEMIEFRTLTAYVFGDNETDPASEEGALVQPEWSTCAFADGRMVSTLAAFPFRMRLNGATADTAGLTAVGTLPPYRRKGLLRRTLTRSFREQRERGQSLAILWASYGGIYQRFGYGPASNYVGYEFDPRWVGLHPGLEATGSVRIEADRDSALPRMKKLYREHSGPRNLLLHRADPTWHFGVCRASDKKHKTYLALYENADGKTTGHVSYQLENEDGQGAPWQTMTVCDFIALDVDAHIGLWEFIRSHDLVSRVKMGPVAEDDPSPLLVQEAEKLGRRMGEGIFLRVVDAERALGLRPYAAAGRLVVEIPLDPHCDWNEGCFEIEAGEGEQRVKRVGTVPDLSLPPRSLGSLLAGHSSASQLARAGLLDARDDQVLKIADRMFATAYRPFCPDNF